MDANIKTNHVTDAAEEHDPELQALADGENAVLLSFIGSYVPHRYGPTQFARSTVSAVDEFSIEEALNIIEKRYQAESRKLYLLLNTSGGSVASSFKIAWAIRQCFDDITVFVPHNATSGGTMIALAGDRIRMGIMSQLGPVDVQVSYKGGTVSANSVLDAESRLENHTNMKRPDELSYVERHLVDSLDPVIQIEMSNTVSMGLAYLDAILTASGYDKGKRRRIREALVFTLPTHGFVISQTVAREAGIAVEDRTKNADEWEIMRKWFWRYIGQAADRHFVRFVVPKKREE